MNAPICFHQRSYRNGVYRIVEKFYVDTIPYRTVKTEKNKDGVIGEIPGTEQTGFMCPKDNKIYRQVAG